MPLKASWALWALVLLGIGAPAHAEWKEARTRHFIIYADEPADELRAYAQKLERFDQAVRTVRRMGDPPLTDNSRVTIFILPSEASVQIIYGGSSWIYGFYVTRVSGSVAFVPRKAGSKFDKYSLDADAVFFHEYAHHLQLQSADAALPSWVSEGFAEFFARTELRDDGSAVIGVPPAYRGYNLFQNKALNLRYMLAAETSLSQTQFEGIYSHGWALTHYLTFARDRRGQLERYIASIQQGVPPLRAAEQAFGDLETLSKEVNGYSRREKLPQLVLTGMQPSDVSITVRPLSDAESAIMRVHMRSERGATKSTARDIAADARKVAANYPNDPSVQTALAQAEFDAKNYAAADSAADRALAANPASMAALIDKGKAQMELAGQAGGGNWTEIRRWFLRANKLDPEAAEPLMFFYKTYLYAGERPTKNAVDGLLYALALAPQDSKLRLMAVRQLVVDGRVDAAKRYFGPFAFSPHSKKSWQDASAKAVTAMTNGQRDVALGQVEKLQKFLEEDD